MTQPEHVVSFLLEEIKRLNLENALLKADIEMSKAEEKKEDEDGNTKTS